MSQGYNQRSHVQNGRSNGNNREKMDRECPNCAHGVEAESRTSLRVDSRPALMRLLTGHSLSQKMDSTEVFNGAYLCSLESRCCQAVTPEVNTKI